MDRVNKQIQAQANAGNLIVIHFDKHGRKAAKQTGTTDLTLLGKSVYEYYYRPINNNPWNIEKAENEAKEMEEKFAAVKSNVVAVTTICDKSGKVIEKRVEAYGAN